MERGFCRERDAYAHLLQSGACARGSVPMCYGWLTLTAHDIEKIIAIPDLAPSGKRLRFLKDSPPSAMLLEYFADAARLSIDNVSEKLADVAFRALYDVHKAYVYHGDIHERNVLVLPGGRVVWVDFNSSSVPADKSGLSRLALLEEAAQAWGLLYDELVSPFNDCSISNTYELHAMPSFRISA